MPVNTPRGLLDASALMCLADVEVTQLPARLAVAATTVAELSAGTHAATKPEERARRQEVLQRVEATFHPLPFDDASARAYGRVCAAAAASGRRARGTRVAELQTAAVALAHGVPLVTARPRDYRGLEELVSVIEVRPSSSR